MVDCVVIVEKRHHVAERLKTCHRFEVYFRVPRGNQRWRFRFGNGAPKGSRGSDSSADDQDVIAIVGDGFGERGIAVHVWMIGVGFILLFMTPFFIAMQMEKEEADD
jgi:hypothetical protein